MERHTQNCGDRGLQWLLFWRVKLQLTKPVFGIPAQTEQLIGNVDEQGPFAILTVTAGLLPLLLFSCIGARIRGAPIES